VLEDLLDILREGSAYSYDELAARLGTSQVMLETMLEDLGRMGYIKQVAAACEGACASCSMNGVCAVGSSGRVWTLTEKGANAKI
jgi:hypothetical protein